MVRGTTRWAKVETVGVYPPYGEDCILRCLACGAQTRVMMVLGFPQGRRKGGRARCNGCRRIFVTEGVNYALDPFRIDLPA